MLRGLLARGQGRFLLALLPLDDRQIIQRSTQGMLIVQIVRLRGRQSGARIAGILITSAGDIQLTAEHPDQAGQIIDLSQQIQMHRHVGVSIHQAGLHPTGASAQLRLLPYDPTSATRSPRPAKPWPRPKSDCDPGAVRRNCS